jgi:hypothetical protein
MVTLRIPLFSRSIISPLLYFNNNLKPTQNMQGIVESTYIFNFFLSLFLFFNKSRPPPTPTQQPPQGRPKDTQ